MKKQKILFIVVGVIYLVLILSMLLAIWLISSDEDFEKLATPSITAYALTNERPTETITADPEVEVVGEIVVVEIIEEPKYIIDITEEEIDLLARMVMSESSTLDYMAKVGIAKTAINRVLDSTGEFANQKTISDVIYFPNAYSTQDNGKVTAECYDAVYNALEYEDCFPNDMFWFAYGFTPAYGHFYVTVDGNTFTTVNDYYEMGEYENDIKD